MPNANSVAALSSVHDIAAALELSEIDFNQFPDEPPLTNREVELEITRLTGEVSTLAGFQVQLEGGVAPPTTVMPPASLEYPWKGRQERSIQNKYIKKHGRRFGDIETIDVRGND